MGGEREGNSVEPEPVFAAIEDWKKALSIEEEFCRAQRKATREELEDLEDAAYDAASERIEAMHTVFETVPTTLAGLRAKIDFAGCVWITSPKLFNKHTTLSDSRISWKRFTNAPRASLLECKRRFYSEGGFGRPFC
jgi:hypothetical protein